MYYSINFPYPLELAVTDVAGTKSQYLKLLIQYIQIFSLAYFIPSLPIYPSKPCAVTENFTQRIKIRDALFWSPGYLKFDMKI